MSAATAMGRDRTAIEAHTGQLPRLLLGLRPDGRAMTLPEHRSVHGHLPTGGPAVIDAVEHAGLRGRGGAGFPTATKLRAVARVARRWGGAVVVVNGTEGEPASAKDRLLLTRAPHLVLDGAVLAASAVGAREILVCIDRQASHALATVEQAIIERDRETRRPLPIRILGTPSRYVAGEETALVRWLSGGPARPTGAPPRPAERGVDGKPTLVDNVETLAHLAQIVGRGASWFRQLGPPSQPGTALATVSGSVTRPDVYEVPFGVPLARVLTAAGIDAAGLGGVLIGGYFGSWLTAEEASRVRFADQDLRPLGASVGCGVVVALPSTSCGWCETARLLTWMAGESAGQCGPCVHGLAAVARAATDLATSHGTRETVGQLHRWAAQIEGRGACRFPDGALQLLRSALRVFAPAIETHLYRGCPSPGGRATFVPLPATEKVSWR